MTWYKEYIPPLIIHSKRFSAISPLTQIISHHWTPLTSHSCPPQPWLTITNLIFDDYWRLIALTTTHNYQPLHSHFQIRPSLPITYIGCPKTCTDYIMSYLQKYWIWRLQISYSDLAWVKLVHWNISCDSLNLFKLCRYLKISKFSALW